MPTRWTIAALCVLLGALAAHARILDVRGVGADDDDPTAPPATESTAAPSTTPSSDVDPYCLTCDGVNNQRYQLIRGEDEVDKCNKQIYCDCIEHTQKKCEGWGLAFNPDKQKCAYMFSCESWLNKHTSTAAPPTSTAPPGPQPTVPPTTATASTATPTTAAASTATPTIAPAPTVTQTTPTRPPTAAPQTGSTGPQTTTGSPGNQTTTVSPGNQTTTVSPGTQKTTVTGGPPPTPVPVPATTPSSAWANKATALTIVCLAAVVAL